MADLLVNGSTTQDIHTNFMDFHKEYAIEIPLIQRDYVQGSDAQQKKRDEFIDSLWAALVHEEESCELDFIYGTYQDGIFRPLDGQQRLTTLFLLHWFLVMKSYGAGIREKLITQYGWGAKGFSYKTRRSSTVFLEKLKTVKAEQLAGVHKISTFLKNQPWFSVEWTLDPSVQAMLDMLDALNKKYEGLKKANPQKADPEKMLERLFTTRAINFNKLDMGKYKLTDSLYVKMNARGKQLTEFENWKAKFIQFLEEHFKEGTYTFAEEDRSKDFSQIKDYFTHSIEHEWTDLLWKYAIRDYDKRKKENERLPPEQKKEKVRYPLIDDYFLNFYYYIFRMLFFSGRKNQGPITEEKEDSLKDFAGTEELRRQLFAKQDNLEFLYRSLDLFVHIASRNKDRLGIDEFFNDIFYISISPNLKRKDGKVRLFSSQSTNLFESCIKGKLNVDEQVLLYGIIRYCLRHACYEATDELKRYVRVCRNLLESINQRLTKDMKIHSNVRLNELPKYQDTIDSLCSVPDVVSLPTISGNMGDTEEAGKVSKYYPNDEIYHLEDSGYTHGCLYALDLENFSAGELDDAFDAFRKATDLERVKLLVAFGYKGADFGGCGHGKRVFFGYKDRWDVLFRYEKEAKNSLKTALSGFVQAFKACPDITSLIDSWLKQIQHKDSFVYYMLRYDAFSHSALPGILDEVSEERKADATHFFAIKSEFDIVSLPRFNGKPLRGYHTDPYACAVAREIKKRNAAIYSKMNYIGKDREKACIFLSDSTLRMKCTDSGWEVRFDEDPKKKKLPQSKWEEICKKWREDFLPEKWYLLPSLPDKDRIEIAVDFILDVCN